MLLCLGAGLGATASASWLELERGLRALVRLLALAAGLGLALGAVRLISAGVALATLGVAASFDYVPATLAVQLGVLCLLAGLPSIEDEPWTLARSPFGLGAGAHPHPHWTTAAWLGFALSMAALSAAIPPFIGLPTMSVCLFAVGWALVRGPEPWVIVLLLAAYLVGTAFSAAPFAHLLLLLCGALSLVDQSWLPAVKDDQDDAVLFYDGVCGLCQASIQLILREDRLARLRLSPLQGETARSRLAPARVDATSASDAPTSMVVLSRGRELRESDAALFLARQLGGAWRMFEVGAVLPPSVRNAIYLFVARNRYSWFGKLDACPVPDAATRARFLP